MPSSGTEPTTICNQRLSGFLVSELGPSMEFDDSTDAVVILQVSRIDGMEYVVSKEDKALFWEQVAAHQAFHSPSLRHPTQPYKRG
eukprot:scaffold42218_cov37-Prasinocladus_malaysianus.AAC.1